MPEVGLAQNVIPASLPDNQIGNVQLVQMDDVTVNADMLMTHHSTTPLKVTVWDMGSTGNPCLISPFMGMNYGNVFIRVEDWNGNVATASINMAAHPDVVIGDVTGVFMGQDYSVAVSYVEEKLPASLLPWVQKVQFYKIQNAGTPAISLQPGNVVSLNFASVSYQNGGVGFSCWAPYLSSQVPLLMGTQSFPHLDILPRPGAGPAGLPLMEELLVAYESPTGAGPRIFFRHGSMSQGFLQGQILLSNLPGTDPDVACQYNYSNPGAPLAHFIYNSGPNLIHHTLNMATNSASAPDYIDISANPVGTFCALFPRIEAMNLWHKSMGVMPWQAIGIKQDLTNPNYISLRPFGYNPNTPPTDLYQIPPFPWNPVNLGVYTNNMVAVMSPCVTAGCGPGNPFSGELGNSYYTVGYYPWATDIYMYARNVDPYTGLVYDDYYQINQNGVWAMDYAGADASKSLALATCSNTGQGQMAAWFDGALDIWDKTNLSNTTQFRTTEIGQDAREGDIHKPYPNPAIDRLILPTACSYDVYDLRGTVVLRGAVKQGDAAINITNLAPGQYLLRTNTGQLGHSYKFTKQ